LTGWQPANILAAHTPLYAVICIVMEMYAIYLILGKL
jgi:hypothetical protein